MYRNKRVAVVVPAYNEEKLISQTIDDVPDFVDHIIVVDDCSKDETGSIVREHIKSQPDRIIVITHRENLGVGGSIASGYKWCRDEEVDIAVVMGGDGQMDPHNMPELLDPIADNDCDYSKGNRLFYGDAWNSIPRVRYLGNSILSMLTKIASGYWHIADSQSGYTAINLRALQTVNWDQMYQRYGQPNDILVRLNIYNFRVCDVPIRPIYGIGERSGIRPILIIPKLAWLLLTLFLWRMKEKYVIRDFHPLVFFYAMGIFLFIPGIVLGLYLLAYRILVGPVAPTSALFAVFLVVSGLQSLFFAMWFDMESNRNLR